MRTIIALLLAYTARATRANHTTSIQETPCVLLQRDIQYADHHIDEEPQLACETLDGNILSLNVSRTWKAQHLGRDAFSGTTTLLLKGSRIHDGILDIDERRENQMEIIDLRNEKRGFRFEPEPHRHLQTQGTKNILVLRVTSAYYGKQDSSEQLLSDSIFGSGQQFPVNFKSQMEGCSFGKIRVEPASGKLINDGVLTVDVHPESDSGRQVQKAIQTAESRLGYSLKEKHDHVMVCLPQHKGWLAYAYLNHYISVYNNVWCSRLSTQVHELSHNIGLLHAGSKKTRHPYGDTSSVMGFSYPVYNGPKMCFNGAQSWQLGWYSDRQSIASPLQQLWKGRIYGIADYSSTPSSDAVILKVEGESGDYYVAFNRRTGINSGTQLGSNNVLVTTRNNGSDPDQTWLVGNLAPGQTWSEPFDGTTLYVTFDTIESKGKAEFANVMIYTDLTRPITESPTLSPTLSPTISPSLTPTLSPTQYPTTSPTPTPTISPTIAPTNGPTLHPTTLLLDLNLGSIILKIDGTLTKPEALQSSFQSYLNSALEGILDGIRNLELEEVGNFSRNRRLEIGRVEYQVTGCFQRDEVPPAKRLTNVLKEAMEDTAIVQNVVTNSGAGTGLTISQIQVANSTGVFQVVTQTPTLSPTQPQVELKSVCEAIGGDRFKCFRQRRECTWNRTICIDKQKQNRGRIKKRAQLFNGRNNV